MQCNWKDTFVWGMVEDGLGTLQGSWEDALPSQKSSVLLGASYSFLCFFPRFASRRSITKNAVYKCKWGQLRDGHVHAKEVPKSVD